MEKKPGPPPAPPAGDDLQKAPVQIPMGGRGAFIQRMQLAALETPQQQPKPPEQSLAPTPTPSISSSVGTPTPMAQPPVSRGRGKLLAVAAEAQARSQPAVTVPPGLSQSQPCASAEGNVETITRQMKRLQIPHDTPPVIMKGTTGEEIEASANYIPLRLLPGRGIYEYEVRFSPPVDDRALCDKLLFVQHKEVFGRRRTFDGVTLYTPQKLPPEATNLTSTHPVTNEIHTISVIFRRERSMTECTHMYNVLFNIIQKELNLVKLKREYFSQEFAHSIPQHKLEIWPGYVTAVDVFEGGIMLNCNVTHKVLRTQTVLDLIKDIIGASGGRDWKELLQKQLIGQSVMTRRPVNIYRVDDIDFKQNPTSTFTKPDGTVSDYIEYHRRKDIHIKDTQQPLLVHRPKPSKRPGQSGLYLLVPELCYMTGLTDEMRSDFKVMKDVAMYTRVNPNQRQRSLQNFIENIRTSPNCIKLLDEWGLQVPDDTIKLPARVLPVEQLHFGRNFVTPGSNEAEWNRQATSQHMLEVVPMITWLVVHTQRDERTAKGFIEMMGKVCPQMGVRIEYPAVHGIANDKTETYLKSLKDGLKADVQFVVVIFPSARDDRYSAIKKLCCVDRPVPSQVINSKTIFRPEKLRPIVQKIALQINCKLGGALWALKMPNLGMMICGVDTYHDTRNRNQSVAGFVASMNPSVTRWYSQVKIQSSDRELMDGLRTALSMALNKYYEVNNSHPEMIVIFRDGVGDGQLQTCKAIEIESLQKAFTSVSPDYNPTLLFIVCQKRINTRIFLPKRDQFENPPPGTIVDHTVTRRYYQDFFLVSQLVKQGTVTPTHYIVLHNSTGLSPDKIQRLTYKMCHLYYNWPGTIRIPAPCQYAHKLAFLVGNNLHREPAHILSDKLFFL